MGKEGGKAILKKYGKNYFKQLRKKVSSTSLSKNGRKSGNLLKQKYGPNYFKNLGRIGGKNFSKKISNDKNLQLRYREDFITRMKTFTRKHETISGIKVRSKMEKDIADFLTNNNINFDYETKQFHTKYGDYEPDFIVDDKLIEIFGMDTDFYFKKKIPKLISFLINNKNENLIIFTNISKLPDEMKPLMPYVIKDRTILLKRLIGP